MAAQSFHDAVIQPESADAPSPADVSALKNIDPAARAAAPAHPASIENSAGFPAEPGSSNLESADTTLHNADAHGMNQHLSQQDETPPITKGLASSDDTTETPSNVNGILDTPEAREVDLAEDASTRSAGIDGSLGSDTDTSKAEGASALGKDAIPRYSVRKSTTFKPVSVTKNLLAKTSSVSTPTKANGDKAPTMSGSPSTASAQPIARPRLVAKIASGPRSSAPKLSSLGSKNGREAGPDPNQVWNRNRLTSTPQATPKHLTDEELRQQYGIQLASRPQEDGDSKEAKWADIDDDEDDWAPETIEWNDGTKINLSQNEPPPSATEAPAEPLKEEKPEGSTSKSPMQKLTTVGPNATVLKLGSAAQVKTITNTTPKPSEKPTLVSKPAAPTPVKSPWAPLPAVDKVPPIAINTPVEQLPSRFGQRNMHGFDAMPPPPPPQAKEIAADDFSRLSRDSPSSGPRELFNSQSGRYEPVNDARRQSLRKEGNFRQPSVLQRPSPSDVHGPAEPSPSFQTASWSRRRGSSNVSGESGKFAQRVPVSKGLDNRTSENLVERRGSQGEFLMNSAPSSTGRRPSQSDASPVVSHGEPLTPQLPPGAHSPYVASSVPATQQYKPMGGVQGPSSPAVPNEEAVAAQRRLMHERREAAIKRRQEEEAKEEAARKERIQLRMKQAGLLDKPSEKPGDDAVEKDVQAKAEPSAATAKDLKESKETQPNHPTSSPPKPPPPSATGQPQQYGLMKLHGPQPVVNLSPVEPSAHKPGPPPPVSAEKKADIQVDRPASKPNGEVVSAKPTAKAEPSIDSLQKGLPTDARSPWSAMQSPQPPQSQAGTNGFPGWNKNATTTRTSPSGNLWGPPTNHKALGNGDFQNNIHLSQMRPQQQPYSAHLMSPQPPPQPIGTPRQPQAQQQQRVDASNLKSSDATSRSLVEDSQTIPAFPPETGGVHPRQQPLHSLVSDQSGPTHPQAGANIMMQRQVSNEQPKVGMAAWHHFAANATKDDAERRERSKLEMEARLAEQQRKSHVPTITETWKKVANTPGTVDSRKVVESSQVHHQRGLPGVDQKAVTQHPAQQVRSRYQDLFDQSRAVPMTVPPVRSNSPSAPPPDSFDHPAYVGPTQKPLVNLPGSQDANEDRPAKPIVRLPPAKSSAVSQTVNVPEQRPMAAPVRGVSQPLVANPTWQDRFNGLFDRKTSPEKKHSDITTTTFSSSRVPFEMSNAGPSTTTSVTLPPKRKLSASANLVPSFEDEDALFDGPKEMGWRPTVHVPAMAPASAWTPAKEPVHKYKFARRLHDRDVHSVDTYLLRDFVRSGSTVPVTIFLQGMAGPQTRTMTAKAGMGADGTAHAGQRGPQRHHNSVRGKPKGQHKRDSAGSANAGGQHQQQQGQGAQVRNGGPMQGAGPKPRPKPGNAGAESKPAPWTRKPSGVAT